MNQVRRILAIGLWLAMLAVPAQSQTVETGSYGAWTSFEGRSSRGRQMCGIYARGGDRSLYFKYFAGEADFSMQIYKASWEVLQPTPVRVQLRLGAGYVSNPLNATAYPRQNGAQPMVEANLRFEGSEEFWSALRAATQGRLEFLTGNEGTWTISLNGSNAAVTAMADCIRRIGSNGPTAPFDTNTRTQPFGQPAPGPTAPFGSNPGGSSKFQ